MVDSAKNRNETVKIEWRMFEPDEEVGHLVVGRTKVSVYGMQLTAVGTLECGHCPLEAHCSRWCTPELPVVGSDGSRSHFGGRSHRTQIAKVVQTLLQLILAQEC